MSESLREKKPSGRQWSPDFCCMTPPIWASEASVAKESSAFGGGCWRGTAATRRRLAFWNASCAETVYSNFWAPPFRRSVKGFKICAHLGKKKAVKFYHAKKTLQLLDILRGWGWDFGGMIGRRGRSCHRNCMTKNLKRGCCQHTFFQIDGEAIGGQSC